eukprot:snap_masked-scaffold_26-processed-gene-4.83-mRNA-1 protein AED:1.00 eAED:1.00 QI:0/0/0/0/1/1/2/0/110
MNLFILRNLLQMCSDYSLPYEQGPDFIHVVADTINNTPTRQGYTPNELTSIFDKNNKIASTELEGSIELTPLAKKNELILEKDPESFVNTCRRCSREKEKESNTFDRERS